LGGTENAPASVMRCKTAEGQSPCRLVQQAFDLPQSELRAMVLSNRIVLEFMTLLNDDFVLQVCGASAVFQGWSHGCAPNTPILRMRLQPRRDLGGDPRRRPEFG
jgi:hypothetical protein